MECRNKADAGQVQVESAKKFGVELKDMQIKAMLSFIGGRDTFVSLSIWEITGILR